MAKYKRKKQKTTYIYEIKAGKYYYIGKSNRPWIRLEEHKRKAIENTGKNYRKNRIFKKNLRNLQLRILERPKISKWRGREVYWIAKYRKKYGRNRILNASDGGDGATGAGYDDRPKPVTSFATTIYALIFCLFGCYILAYWIL